MILLEHRIAIILVKEKLTFSTSAEQYKTKLKEYFNSDYALIDIKNTLDQLECNYLEMLYEQEKEGKVTEAHEDFDIVNINQLV